MYKTFLRKVMWVHPILGNRQNRLITHLVHITLGGLVYSFHAFPSNSFLKMLQVVYIFVCHGIKRLKNYLDCFDKRS